MRAIFYTSKGQGAGTELWQAILASGRRRQSYYHHFMAAEENCLLKTLAFTGVQRFRLERLKYAKRGRGAGRSLSRSRQSNVQLSFCHYSRVVTRLTQRCDEQGYPSTKDPWKTSQHCFVCGHADRSDRGLRCLTCCHMDDAPHWIRESSSFCGWRAAIVYVG